MDVITIRNSTIGFFYKNLLKPLFFSQDPEGVHDHMIKTGKMLGTNAITRNITEYLFGYRSPSLSQTILGIEFVNPIGLAAGFDKNAELTSIIDRVGFGFEEVGSITGEPCAGNPKPRLWRLPQSKSLVVYYGLKNDGAEVLSKKLQSRNFQIPIGISVAKTNCAETCDTDAGIQDYVKAYRAFETIGAYYTINISCPNAFGGQPFTDALRLDGLLQQIFSTPKTKPVFIKFSPDLSNEEVNDILKCIDKYPVDGLIISNLTKKRDNKNIKETTFPDKGGFSGKVVEDLSNEMIKYVYTKTKGRYVIIGCGGVFTAQDAYRKIKLGASLIQMITGMIYQGPQTISTINHGLVTLLQKDGYSNISEAIGKEAGR